MYSLSLLLLVCAVVGTVSLFDPDKRRAGPGAAQREQARSRRIEVRGA
jgi:hypothetical protein